jgi:tetratricopeptide (TPR) repeat protein
MKKIVFTGILCFLVSLSFGQKKAVSDAKNELKNTPPNFTEARNLIKDALTNPETANDAETWYVAGQIENKQFDAERALQILGKQPNEEVMYSALEKVTPYFKKAADLDQLPDAKGKIKPRFLKDIRANIRANRPFYINAGLSAYDKKNYKLAYENFKEYGDIPSMDIFKDEKWDIAKGDTTELQIRYYAGVAASLIPDPQASLTMFNDLKNKGYVPNSIYTESAIYQYVAQAYNQLGDSANFEKTIKEGFLKFPGEEYYVLNLINLSINTGKMNEAITYLDKAIAQDPNNAQFYDVMGQVYEQDKKSDEAIKYMQKAVDMDAKNIDFLSHLGRVYFNLGVEKRTVADETSDVNKSKELSAQSKDYFRQAMPFFERIFEQDSKNTNAIYALRSIYYNLGMNEQYGKMDALYSKDQ